MFRSLVIAALAVPAVALAQGKPGPHSELYLYKGADRDQKVLAAAKKEGKVVIYGSLESGIMDEIEKAFTKKYGVPIEYYRAASNKTLDRVMTESRAGDEAAQLS